MAVSFSHSSLIMPSAVAAAPALWEGTCTKRGKSKALPAATPQATPQHPIVKGGYEEQDVRYLNSATLSKGRCLRMKARWQRNGVNSKGSGTCLPLPSSRQSGPSTSYQTHRKPSMKQCTMQGVGPAKHSLAELRGWPSSNLLRGGPLNPAGSNGCSRRVRARGNGQ